MNRCIKLESIKVIVVVIYENFVVLCPPSYVFFFDVEENKDRTEVSCNIVEIVMLNYWLFTLYVAFHSLKLVKNNYFVSKILFFAFY